MYSAGHCTVEVKVPETAPECLVTQLSPISAGQVSSVTGKPGTTATQMLMLSV